MFRKLKGRTVVVNTTTDEGFRGTVISATPWVLRLRDCTVLTSSQRTTGPAEGIVRISRRIVTWIQEL